MNAALTVLREQIKNFYLIRRLSVYEMKSANSGNYLGILWEIINPMIQIAIYWFVFGFGIFHKKPVEGYPFFPWMIAGIVVWFFFSSTITLVSRSIFSRLNMVSKMSFPLSAIPTYVIFSRLYQHLMLLAVIILILAMAGFFPTVYIIQLPYFMFATVALLFSTGLITSTVATIIRDVQNMISSLIRVLFYLTPILWIMNEASHPTIVHIMKLNPLYYIIEGYRATLLGESWYLVVNWQYSLYFWGVIIVCYLVGSYLHVKFRDRFVDFM